VAQAILAALALKAPLASPALTGVPTAPNAAAKAYTAQIATTRWVRDNLQPVGTYYTQYPAAASNDYATAFPASERPASLFGGTWSIVWDTDKAFFRTGGSQAGESSRGNGYQGDTIRDISGYITGTIAGIPGYWNTASEGVFFISGQNDSSPRTYVDPNILGRFSDIGFRAGRVVPVDAENRPINRRIIIWKKTAL
jgi:hypothetical protein